jgi:hypothetical protein
MSYSPITYMYSYLAKTKTINGEFPIFGLNDDYRCKKPSIQKEIVSDAFLLDEGVFNLLWPQESNSAEETYFIADVEGLSFELNT